MSVDVTQVVLPEKPTAPIPAADDSLGALLLANANELDANAPGTFAANTAAEIAYYGERQQFIWLSLAQSFDFSADAAAPNTDKCITDWDGLASDIVPDPDVSTGGATWDGEDGTLTILSAIAGLLIVRVIIDAEKTVGAAADWIFRLLRNGNDVAATRRAEFTALNSREDVTFEFEITDFAPGDLLCVAAGPGAGVETLRIRKYIIQLVPVRQ